MHKDNIVLQMEQWHVLCVIYEMCIKVLRFQYLLLLINMYTSYVSLKHPACMNIEFDITFRCSRNVYAQEQPGVQSVMTELGYSTFALVCLISLTIRMSVLQETISIMQQIARMFQCLISGQQVVQNFSTLPKKKNENQQL